MKITKNINIKSTKDNQSLPWSVINKSESPDWLEIDDSQGTSEGNTLKLTANVYNLDNAVLRYENIHIDGESEYFPNIYFDNRLYDKDSGNLLPVYIKDIKILHDKIDSSKINDVQLLTIEPQLYSPHIQFFCNYNYTKSIQFHIQPNKLNGPWDGYKVVIPLQLTVDIGNGNTEIIERSVTCIQEHYSEYGVLNTMTERLYIDANTIGQNIVKTEGIRPGYYARTYRFDMFDKYNDLAKQYYYRVEFNENQMRLIKTNTYSNNEIVNIHFTKIGFDKWGTYYDVNSNRTYDSRGDLDFHIDMYYNDKNNLDHCHGMIIKPLFHSTELHQYVIMYWTSEQLQNLKEKLEAKNEYVRTDYYFTEGWDKGAYPKNKDNCKYAFDIYQDNNQTSPTYQSIKEVRNQSKDKQ